MLSYLGLYSSFGIAFCAAMQSYSLISLHSSSILWAIVLTLTGAYFRPLCLLPAWPHVEMAWYKGEHTVDRVYIYGHTKDFKKILCVEGCKNQASFVLPVVMNPNSRLMSSKFITIKQYKPLSHSLVQKLITVSQRLSMSQSHRTILCLHSEIITNLLTNNSLITH